jgi:hypothetical protein
MLYKNGMLPKDTFHETYKQIEEHKDEIKKKSRKVRESLSNGDFSLPESTNGNGNGNNHKDL